MKKKIEETYGQIILMVLCAASRINSPKIKWEGLQGLPINQEYLDAYIWLLRYERKPSLLSFKEASFNVGGLPRSYVLRDDLQKLINLKLVTEWTAALVDKGFLDWINSKEGGFIRLEEVDVNLLDKYISISDEGKSWLKKNIKVDQNFDLHIGEIATALDSYSRKDVFDLSQRTVEEYMK